MKLKTYLFGFAAVCAGILVPAKTAHAQSGSAQNSALLDALVKKGVLSDQEAEDINAQEEKQWASTGASKIQMPSSIKTITFYGDLRLRYEYRQGSSPAGYTASGGGFSNAPESQTLSRWRYRLRLGLKGDLYDSVFYGLRAATNYYYNRSGNINFGASGMGGPFGEGRNIMAIDQVYLGWKATPDLTFIGGQMPQPLYSTTMVWDDNLNPAGAAEKYDHTFDNGVELFATAGQFVYNAANGGGAINNFNGGSSSASTTFMFAEQVGFKYSFDKDTFFKGAATFYTYSGTNGGNPTTVAGLYPGGPISFTAPNNSPSYYNGPFVGAASAPTTNVTGINNLAVLDFPMEFDFKIGPGIHKSSSGDPKAMVETESGWDLPVRVFADFAYNVDADARADAARNALSVLSTTTTSNVGVTNQGSAALNSQMIHSPTFQGVLNSGKNFQDQCAYQVGAEFGRLKKKGDWDGKLYWQSIGYYALDPNLIDADIFNAATNMQGVVAQVSHNWTDGISSSLRYAYGMPVNGAMATPNVNQDLQLGDIRHYNLMQADIMWKF